MARVWRRVELHSGLARHSTGHYSAERRTNPGDDIRDFTPPDISEPSHKVSSKGKKRRKPKVRYCAWCRQQPSGKVYGQYACTRCRRLLEEAVAGEKSRRGNPQDPAGIKSPVIADGRRAAALLEKLRHTAYPEAHG